MTTLFPQLDETATEAIAILKIHRIRHTDDAKGAEKNATKNTSLKFFFILETPVMAMIIPSKHRTTLM